MSVETEPIWFTTGNPFVDTGQEMMAALAKVDSASDLTKEDVKPWLPRLIDLYFTEGWLKNSYSIFPNSELNNGNNRRERYRNLLDGWIDVVEDSTEKRLDTVCGVSGRHAQVYIGKKYLPMSDAEFYNFQSGSQQGTPVSASVALALQFFPLGLIKVGKMMALPHFSSAEAQIQWADRMADDVNFDETVGTGGVGEVGTSRPVNAFFRLIERLVQDQRECQEIIQRSRS